MRRRRLPPGRRRRPGTGASSRKFFFGNIRALPPPLGSDRLVHLAKGRPRLAGNTAKYPLALIMASATSYKNLKGKKVGVCVSGGLDSKTVCKRLVEEGLEVLAFSADLGQPDESDINNVRERMATCGVETVIVDLKEAMAEGCFDAVQAQAKYDGGCECPRFELKRSVPLHFPAPP